MVNFNGVIQDSDLQLTVSNRSFLYGDGVFETLKIVNNKILFFEDHYFRLMASMRIVRMEIPMSFTIEYLEEQILKLVEVLAIEDSARIRFTVFRNEGGFYLPTDNSISYVIQANKLDSIKYKTPKSQFEVDLYKDFIVPKQLLSTLKTTNKITNVTASIFAKENQLDSSLLINETKNVIEAANGNLFMLMGSKLITPPISEGCLNGIMRKQIITLAKQIDSIEVIEAAISPFDLQKADELFITNVIIGIQPITKYRKKEFEIRLANQLLEKLNNTIEA
ncbi:aminotransferase class IV [Flavobacterium paronense]|uniref:branched-chain-amino-acid transaminase n=1 Tax=Flavobacterium paronense TaxID=1392775 RepID=A0ABV5GCG7_9FLAO|nr:aminotransferase class IV [Flavobacterium paronense]MDN3675832.1 aminotransferase class IV [Flavobacterium paronense]MDN3675841.1 aminotransferase class IV [Flavobacterium paronense]MDN3677932.1 aminotransferase class IV [Flavobacterium paronense]